MQQGCEHVPVQAQPAGVGEVLVHQPAPCVDRQPVGGFEVPRHLLHAEACLTPGENRAGEQQFQRDQTVTQGLQVLGGGNVEVKSAGQREPNLGLAGEALDHGAALQPEEGLQGGGPAAALAEEVQQTGLFLGCVAAALGQDPDLAAQGDGVYCGPGGLGHPQRRGELGRCRIRFRLDVQDVEGQGDHGRPPDVDCRVVSWTGVLRLLIFAKKEVSWSRASWPPSKPRHRRRRCPTSS